jgi:MSHA pilin protein MshA
MNKSIKTAQSGFTLIELIVVIVILGILAATAMPKFANMGGDARAATVQAAKGALSATSAMVHGKYLVNPSAATNADSMVIEGVTVSFLNGYPKSDANFVTAAGLDGFVSTAAAGAVTLVPTTINGTSAAANCFVRYTDAASTTTPPVITVDTTSCRN